MKKPHSAPILFYPSVPKRPQGHPKRPSRCPTERKEHQRTTPTPNMSSQPKPISNMWKSENVIAIPFIVGVLPISASPKSKKAFFLQLAMTFARPSSKMGPDTHFNDVMLKSIFEQHSTVFHDCDTIHSRVQSTTRRSDFLGVGFPSLRRL